MKSKKKKEVLFRHKVIKWFLLHFVGPIYVRIFGFRGHRYSLKHKEPHLILANHMSGHDPIFIGMAFDVPLYYVSTEMIMNAGFTSHLLRYSFNPIPKSKVLPDIATITQIKRVMDQGGSVVVFVEGNLSINGATAEIPLAIGKLAKFLKRPLLFYTLHGVYLSNPRWATTRKHGPSWGSVTDIMPYSDYQNMPVETLNNLIAKKIALNAYKEQKIYAYRGKKLAEGLERLLFACPQCHSINTIMTKNDHYYCSSCGLDATYDEHGYLQAPSMKRQDLVTLDHQVKFAYQETLLNNKTYTLKVEGTLFYTYERHRRKQGNFHLSVRQEALHLVIGNNEQSFSYETLLGYAIQGKNKFILYLKNQPTILLIFDEKTSPYQLLITLQIFENLHRYHKGEVEHDLLRHLGL